MYRYAIESLKKWKDKKGRLPIILRGARQTGKTWLMKEFGRTCFENTVYINFDNDNRMKELFSGSSDTKRLITGMELMAGHKITPENTLLIFDEVQEVPKALSSLKYFAENAPEYYIAAAGSLLGVALHEGTSFPVGKVEFLDLYPLNFNEFLMAMGKEQLVRVLEEGDFAMAAAFRQDYTDMLKYYYYVGGMPEVVVNFAGSTDFHNAREIQQRILDAYEQDFSKHAPHDTVPRIRMLWNSIPAQLARENRKFIYGLVKEGARAREYELAMLWLIDCGLVHKINRVSKPGIPLKAYEDLKAFKLYVLDVGLLSCMTGLRQDTLIDGNALFTEFKGALTEQYVLQQLKTIKKSNVYYWSNDRGNAEVDFLLDNGENIIPIEVKAEINLQAKSLKTYRGMFSPKLAVRTAMTDYRADDGLINLPLYAINFIDRYV